ncbi:MAG TPA: type II CRISPR RNA-guided endonuclease Cas9, partial [Lacipirellulaceae bacterium]|nr:type II CRISPR RNA-guided endonuclease Cas9 [Lacipirellulaceae bacterium]
RQTARRQRRLQKVFGLLQRAGLLPLSESTHHDERHRLFKNLDRQLKAELFPDADRATNHIIPYRLRAMALDQPLAPHALGRALYHLAQRRGFLSNLKANRDADEQSVVKQGISELAQEMGDRTLGQYFASLDPEELNQRIRRRWTSRKMYRDEFDRIWNAQSPHHPNLDAELRVALEEAIFHQRPLKSQSHLIGRCELEPYKRRIPIASRLYQEFRLLQRVNDVTVTCPDYEVRTLTPDERSKLIKELNCKSELKWAAVKKLLGMRKSKEYGRHFEFNFEQGGDKRIVGHRTDAKMITALDNDWTSRSEDEKTVLVDDVLRFEDEEQLLTRLVDHWKLTPQQAQAVADESALFEQGYGSHSRRAIRKLLPLLRDSVPYSTARKTVYPHSFKAKEVAHKLPPFFQQMRTVRNPAVARTMSEMRKVVNALIDEHGKPEIIRIELARDLKNSRDRRKDMSNQREKNKDARDKARRAIAALKDLGEKYATPHNVLKWRLAEECNWCCPYTGKGIAPHSLIGDEPQFDVEHIIPFSKSLDNSFANKTLCLHEENRNRKGGKTPFQAYGSTSQWEEILQRVRHFQGDLTRRKLQLFQRETLLDSEEFTQRQLSDTRYLSRVAADYLAMLYGGRIDEKSIQRVFATPGSVTKYLRDFWDLNRLLHIYGDPDDPQQKNRADHRHHAIDALLVALSTPKIVADLNYAASQAEKLGTRHLFVEIEPPWPGFSAADVEKVIQGIVVSSRVNRKLNGALHKETIFSKPKSIVDVKTGKPKTVHHVRKPLEKMSRGEIDDIVDGAVKAAVIAQLERLGGDPGKAFADRGNHPHLTAKDGRMIPIHAARIRKADAAISIAQGDRERFVAPGDNHHMEVIAILDKNGAHKRWEGVIVSRYEANQRAAQPSADGEQRAIVRRDHGDQREFLFSLAGGEYLAVNGEGGQDRVLRVTVISGTQIELVDHNDARPITIRKKLPGARVRMSVDRLREAGARKVVVDSLGKVWPAGD